MEDIESGAAPAPDTGDTTTPDNGNTEGETQGTHYVLNTNTKKYHKETCSSVEEMSQHNRQDYYGDKSELEDLGYTPCGRCDP